jgi:hypothetical protein
MSSIHLILRRFGAVLISLLLVLAPPVLSYADTAPPPPNNGIERPSGVGAETFSYNVDNGLWENNYYTWNPVTKETLPKQPLEYTYNPTTGKWDTKIWEFHPSVNKYEQITVSVTTPPAGASKHGSPPPPPPPAPTPALASTASPSLQSASQRVADPVAGGSQPTPAQGGSASPANLLAPSQAPSVSLDSSGGLTVTNASGVALAHNISSSSQSGSALLQNNYQGGNANSGAASAIANIINLLQSAAGLGGADLTTFVKDIQGDVSGDLLIDPAALAQPAADSQSINRTADVAVHNSLDNSITNNVALAAASGNATIDNNYRAGNATTGSADAVANVVNLINSVIAANQSFFGVVNIYGNYTGNILVPTDSLNALLASNGNASTQSVDTATQAATEVTIRATKL